jgi:hypothetical protein
MESRKPSTWRIKMGRIAPIALGAALLLGVALSGAGTSGVSAGSTLRGDATIMQRCATEDPGHFDMDAIEQEVKAHKSSSAARLESNRKPGHQRLFPCNHQIERRRCCVRRSHRAADEGAQRGLRGDGLLLRARGR